MGFDPMRAFLQLSLYSASRSPPPLDCNESLTRQDSIIADSGQGRTPSKASSPGDPRSHQAMPRQSLSTSLGVLPFQAAKAKWSPPPSPTSHSATPIPSPRTSAVRIDPGSSTTSGSHDHCTHEQNDLSRQLFEASCSGDLAGIEILLDQGACVNSCTSVGGLFESFKPAKAGHLSPLAGAASYGHPEAAALLLARGADLNPTNSRSASSPLHQAIRSNDYHLVQFLLERGADVNIDNAFKTTPIMYAVKYGSPELISLVLAYKPDLNKVSFINIAAIHWSIWPGNASVTERLLEAGANPNHSMNDLNTPLHLAVLTGSLSMVRCLLRYGADPLRRNANWESPLCLAETQPDNTEVLQLLRAAIALRK